MKTNMRAITYLIVVTLLIQSTNSIPVSQSASSRPLPRPQLRLHRAAFTPTTRQPALMLALTAAAPGPYAIIQLRGPVTPADRAALGQTGVQLLEYLPDYAYLVRGNPTQLQTAARLPQVYARFAFTLADKLAPSLLSALARGDNDLGQVRIVGWPNEQGSLARDLRTIGVQTQTTASTASLLQTARLESVRWIEPLGQPRLLNDYARAIMNVEPAWQDSGLLLYGAGQIIAVADSGLDTGDMGTLSDDFTGRIVATHIMSAGGHWDDNLGHGTHVAGSVAGAGVQSGAITVQHNYAGSFAGVAPEASLVIQAFEADPETNDVIGLPSDYYQIYSQAYDDGARLHTNSWGDHTGPMTDTEAYHGGYLYSSQRTDQFLWDHPDMAIFFAAGNDGVDGTPVYLFDLIPICPDGDGIVNPDSLLSPGTAKNVITVGATESDRSTGGAASQLWGDVSWCHLFPPISGDYLSDNANGMAAFSSRGPTDDGRVKPDIVTPGTNIVSNFSHHPDADPRALHETNPNYAYGSGTSMATPLTAGAGVLVRQWLIDQGLANPSAAAVKATLLNTTYDIAPGQYGLGATQEVPFTHPNNVAGWGRLDLGFIGAPAPYALWLDDHSSGLSTGETVSYTHSLTRPLEVLTTSQPLRVMLAWTDYPASLSASAQLVNDLDLVVIGPGGVRYYGNKVASGDRVNNVEGVIINAPPLGNYQVGVSGFNVPTYTQPYALAVAGPLQPDIPTPSLTVFKTPNTGSAELGQTITYTYQAINSGDLTLVNVSGSDDKLGTVTFNPSTLAPGQSTSATLTCTVQTGDLPGPIINTVSVSGVVSGSSSISVTRNAMAVVSILNPVKISVTKTTNLSSALVGQTVTYTYHVTNTGSVALNDVSGNDDQLGIVTFSASTLAPGQSASGALTYTVQAADLPGPLLNTVVVSANSVDPPLTATATDTLSLDLLNPARISVVKTANLSSALVGQIITYTYQATNTGSVALNGVGGSDDKLGTVTFSASTLAPDQSASATLTYTVQESDLPGPLLNTVVVSGNSVDPPLTATATDMASVNLVALADLDLVKTPNVASAQVGQTITYIYRATNSGALTLTNVAGNDDRLGAVTFNPTTLAPGQSAVGALVYTVQPGDLPGPLLNTAQVSGTTSVGPPLTATAEDTATVSLDAPLAPGISVVKAANVGSAEVGQTVTYIYWVENSGAITLTNVSGNDDKLGQVTFSLSTLAPGQSAVGALAYTVQQSDLPGPLLNTVSVSGTTFGLPLTATATDTATVSLDALPGPNISVVKAADVGSAVVGQTITYTYWVTNSGAITLTNVSGNDDKLGQVTFSLSTLAPGQSAAGVLTYTVQESDLPGPLLNTVSVSGATSLGPPLTVMALDTATVNLPGGHKLYLPLIIRVQP